MAARKKLSFETSMKRLEEIVQLLEQGDTSLEQSMQLFEEGAKLSAALSHELDQAEQRIKVMVQDKDGVLHEEAFSEMEEI